MNPVQKLWASLKLKWRLTHPIEGIAKPLVRILWDEVKVLGLNLWWALGHISGAVRNIREIVWTWPVVVTLAVLGLWGVLAQAYLAISFWKILAVYILVDVISWTIAQAPEAWKEKPYVR